ncbi:heavy metal-binding domain-containing protein [Shewanella waksmanii]|uniref:heavy metal-binding domain-containing protein n=1 Tax=Shewanella waksmanii TaxID=213783 RepID=UPI00048E5F9C|nr:heavy metal-binding domain-containing protein [Shewanella waksmanii]
MKTIISLVVSAFLVLAMAPQVSAHAHGHHSEQNQSHHCPMHPEVQGAKGDSCPKCGMDLTAKKVAADSQHPNCPHAKKEQCKNCPHGQHAQAKKCPHSENAEHKCQNCPAKGQHHAQAQYDCPMHPEVTGKKGDTCPKCGMNLEPVKSASAQPHKHH